MSANHTVAKNEDISKEIVYIKTLAAESRNAPFIGSQFGIWWGMLLCITLFIHWMILTGHIDIPLSGIGALWLLFGLIGGLGNFLLARNLSRVPRNSSVKNRISESLWTGNIILMFLFGFSTGISAGLGINDYSLSNIMIPLAFGLYGSTNWVLSKLSSENWKTPSIFVRKKDIMESARKHSCISQKMAAKHGLIIYPLCKNYSVILHKKTDGNPEKLIAHGLKYKTILLLRPP